MDKLMFRILLRCIFFFPLIAHAVEQPIWTHTPGPYSIGVMGFASLDLDADGVREVVMTATSRLGSPPEQANLLLISQNQGDVHRITDVTALPYGHMFHSASGLQRYSGFFVLAHPSGDRVVAIVRDYLDWGGGSITMRTFAGKPLKMIASVPVQSNFVMNGIADVDGDGSLEAFGLYERTSTGSLPGVIDYATGNAEWFDATRSALHLAAGQFDMDPALELVFGTEGANIGSLGHGYVVDGATHATQWTHFAGFNGVIRVGNFVGSANVREFMVVEQYGPARVFSTAGGLTPGLSFPITNLGVGALDVVDIDGDEIDDLVVGQLQQSRILAYSPTTGAEIVSLAAPGGAGVNAVAVAQLDPGRPGLEVAHASFEHGRPASLYRVRTLQGGDELFSSHTTIGPMSTLVRANLDGVGADEIVGLSSGRPLESINDEGLSNEIMILDAETGEELRSRDRVFGASGLSGCDRTELAVANMDADPQLEIVALASCSSGFTSLPIVVLDSQSLDVQWSRDWILGKTFAMSLADANGDTVPDIALLVADRVILFDGSNGIQLWESPLFSVAPNGAASLASGNFDADASLELAVTSGSTVRIIDMVSHTILRTLTVSSEIVGQWVEGTGSDCRHVLASATTLSRRNCLTGAELSSRTLAVSAQFVRAITDSNGLLILSDGLRLSLQEDAAITAESAEWGPFLAASNRGSILFDAGVAEVVVGNDYGLARFDFSPFELFSDGFD